MGFVSGRPEKAKHLAQVYGVDPKNIYTYDNYDSLANNPEIDVIYVVLPNSMHPEYTIRALKAGKHVLCEKPMANTPQECEQMIAAAKAASRKLMIGYRVRYEPFNQAMIKMAQDTLGDGADADDPGRRRLQHRRPGAVAAPQGDGRRRLADGHRHLRAQRGAVPLGRGAESKSTR